MCLGSQYEALRFKVQPNIIYPYIDIRHNSWCPHQPSLKMSICTIAPWPLWAFVTYHFQKKHHNFLKSLMNQLYHMAPPSSSICLLQGAEHFFFSDPVLLWLHARNLRTISPQTLLLIGYCLLPFTQSHCFEHTVAYNKFVVFVTNRLFTCVKSQTYSNLHLSKDFANVLDVHKTLLIGRISWVESRAYPRV